MHGGATLKTRVATLARPVSVAGLAKGHIAVCVILAQRMLLAAGHILGPVASVGLLVVQQPTNAELLSCCAVPAGPVARAGSLVAKDAVEPVAVLSALWRIGQVLIVGCWGASTGNHTRLRCPGSCPPIP